jgi:hypothetical protein
MPMSEAQKLYNAKYKRENTKSILVRFFKGDMPVYDHIRESGGSTYLKDLAKRDMQAERNWALVRSGKSSIYAEWHELGLISENEFMAGVEWVLADRGEDKEGSRAIGLVITDDMQRKLMREKSPLFASADYDARKLHGHVERLHKACSSLNEPLGYYREDGGLFGECSWAVHAILDYEVWDIR